MHIIFSLGRAVSVRIFCSHHVSQDHTNSNTFPTFSDILISIPEASTIFPMVTSVSVFRLWPRPVSVRSDSANFPPIRRFRSQALPRACSWLATAASPGPARPLDLQGAPPAPASPRRPPARCRGTVRKYFLEQGLAFQPNIWTATTWSRSISSLIDHNNHR